MSGVKRSAALLPGLFAVFSLSACANSDLARFAPPGIIKYEEIAGDQPVNPEVAESIAEYKARPDTGRFPRLAETPDEDDRPEKRPQEEVESEMDELASARETLEEQLAEDRAEAAAEADEGLALPERRDALESTLDKDAAAAARERREKLKPPPAPDQ